MQQGQLLSRSTASDNKLTERQKISRDIADDYIAVREGSQILTISIPSKSFQTALATTILRCSIIVSELKTCRTFQ